MFLPTKCMNTPKPPMPQKKNKVMDLILFAVAVYLLFTVNWGHTTAFDHLMLFLYVLCVLLRISNIRKSGIREMERRKRMEQMQQQKAEQAAASENTALTENTASTQEITQTQDNAEPSSAAEQNDTVSDTSMDDSESSDENKSI